MQSLDEKTWLPSVVDEVFTTINSTKGKTTAQLVEGDDVPYIAAQKQIMVVLAFIVQNPILNGCQTVMQ